MKSTVFPSMNTAAEAKLKRLVETIADYMVAEVSIETVIVMKVNYPDDRPDIAVIMKRLAGDKTGLGQVGRIVGPELTKKQPAKSTNPVPGD